MTKQESREVLSTTYTYGDGSVHEIRTDMNQTEIAEVQGWYWLSHNPNYRNGSSFRYDSDKILKHKEAKRRHRRKERLSTIR